MQIVAEYSNTNDRLSSRNVASAGFNYFVAALNLDLRLNSTTADLVALGGWRITCLWGNLKSTICHGGLEPAIRRI
jgi:hypothetical protein